MIGTRIGLAAALRVGLAAGVGANEIGNSCLAPVATLDATSGKYCPVNATEWASVLAFAGIASGNPFALWNFQDAAGPITDQIGAFPLTQSGTAPAFQAAVAGWSRFGVTLADGINTGIHTTSASLPTTASESLLVLVYRMMTTTPGATRNIIATGTTIAAMQLTTGPVLKAAGPVNSASGAGSPLSVVRPYVLKFDRTNTTFSCYSDIDLLTPTFDAACTGKSIELANTGTGTTCSAGPILYAAAFRGAAAELTDAKVRNLLQALAWTPTW